MMRILRIAVLLALGIGLAESAASASVPSPSNSTVPTVLTLVGQDGAPDPLGTFTVVVRDLANVPVASSFVVIDFSGVSDLEIADQTHQLDPGLVVDCAAHTARKVTDGSGIATFRIIGAGVGAVPTSLLGSVKVFADGVLLSGLSQICSALDLDGGGLSGTDLSLWIRNYGQAPQTQRGDYDGSGSMGGNDLSLLLHAFNAGHSAMGVAAYCLP